MVWFTLTDQEYEILERGWKKSTIIKLSEYLRRVLFGKPITFYTRNQSLDELMAELIPLRKELNALALNFNQAAQRLDSLEHLPRAEQHWLEEFERDKMLLISKVEEIKMKINLISVQWLQ